MSDEAMIQTAAKMIVSAALAIIQGDPHQWSARPCSSCKTVSNLMGQNFGCYLYQEQQRGQRP